MTTCLIIDDDQFNRELLERVSEMAGVHVIASATDGGEGLEMYYTHTPEIVLLDILMPTMSGVEVLESLHRVNAPAVVIVITAAFMKPYDVQRIMELGAAEIILKPFSPKELVEKLRSIVSKHKAA